MKLPMAFQGEERSGEDPATERAATRYHFSTLQTALRITHLWLQALKSTTHALARNEIRKE
jgi:hypothetical protein